MNRLVLAYLTILAGAFLWCGLIVAAPLLASAGDAAAGWAGVLYEGFHRICHQLEGRSLHVFGEPLAVCSRCSAIYGAFLIGTLAYPLVVHLRTPRQPSKLLLAAALAPMVLDVLLAVSGVYETGTAARLVTGAVFGLLVPFVIIPVVLGAVLEQSTASQGLHYHTKGTLDG